MQKEKFDRIVSFLLGASWAIVLFGALITFQLFLFLGYSLALFITITFVVVSLFLVLALDAFSINREKFYEIKKQTELLEKIYSKHTK
ncbi:MAG: hypothetical protein WC279_11445 [Sulfurimonas sp.]|jgi:hypothetical protein|uniref:hypothetical protein n=1 Tax=unclassified Sulfurimonas TaxID=2623549 RepID=UPI0008B3CC8A|nr:MULTISPECIES: hypothetical protein [unclassified Sulfurimonas]MDO8260581.1 hypothetical protein [Candidatus Magasanikbacteria bacterium]OHE09052.1 MAG: hypothetical protein A2329_07880 [Sulfurimonas sp. RIFOXYB2_FULL_37_5]OHE11235.1 MAG: hypothetical protein A3J96_03800 [Sulfurimonas sp. RIFOXYC2_FULL_36_7]OHE19143.1 MAG: hypothetical protein A2525_02695 [Sulfurimonas sp. RIFOXYD12_FULL_36_11]MBS4068528.1 hypothetical protein [Sulfurimonas sp.]